MLRRPPTSTLFPLHDALPICKACVGIIVNRDGGNESKSATIDAAVDIISGHGRSEEHTSELQSLTNLVCRLLLEKKKNKKREIIEQEQDKDNTEAFKLCIL